MILSARAAAAVYVESAALLHWCVCVCVFSLGYVCGLWEFWTGCGGSTPGLCSVWTVLPPLLCQHKGEQDEAFTSFPFYNTVGGVDVCVNYDWPKKKKNLVRPEKKIKSFI